MMNGVAALGFASKFTGLGFLGFLGFETLTSCEALSEYVHYLRNLKLYIP